MKRILLLAVLLVSGLNVFAQSGTTLKVRLSSGQRLSMSIDDRYYDMRGTSLTIGDVPAGRHYLKIYNVRVGRSGAGRANLVYSGYVNLKPNSFNSAVVDPFERRLSMRTTQTTDGRGSDDAYQDWNDERPGDGGYNDGLSVMRNQEITELGARVKDRSSDADKQELIQSVLGNNTYSTEQMRTVLGWLSFESTKLEVAKWGYDRVADKENYWKLEDVFNFSSSKSELTEYIGSKKDAPANSRDRYTDNNRGRYEDDNGQAISDQDITDLGVRVKDRMGDSEKQKLVQSVLEGKEYYTDQVQTILSWFSFDSTKLDVAKWAYAKTIDKENYWKLEDVFSYSSSKVELREYTKDRK